MQCEYVCSTRRQDVDLLNKTSIKQQGFFFKEKYRRELSAKRKRNEFRMFAKRRQGSWTVCTWEKVKVLPPIGILIPWWNMFGHLGKNYIKYLNFSAVQFLVRPTSVSVILSVCFVGTVQYIWHSWPQSGGTGHLLSGSPSGRARPGPPAMLQFWAHSPPGHSTEVKRGQREGRQE